MCFTVIDLSYQDSQNFWSFDLKFWIDPQNKENSCKISVSTWNRDRKSSNNNWDCYELLFFSFFVKSFFVGFQNDTNVFERELLVKTGCTVPWNKIQRASFSKFFLREKTIFKTVARSKFYSRTFGRTSCKNFKATMPRLKECGSQILFAFSQRCENKKKATLWWLLGEVT